MIFDCLTISCIYGVSPLIDKHLSQIISIESIIIIFGFCYFIFSVGLGYLYRKELMHDISVINKTPHLYVFILISSFLVFIVANYLFLGVIKTNKTYLGVGITSIYPIITLLAGYIFLNETFSYTHLSGLFVLVLGIILLVHG